MLASAEPDEYRVHALTAGSRWAEVAAQARVLKPDVVVMADEAAASSLASELGSSCEVAFGEDALRAVSAAADVTINGIVGFAGLPSTLACLNAGKRLGLANKESLIAAGPVVQVARQTPGAELVPVDSEHAAVHQCLRANDGTHGVARLQITASGGPFRGMDRAQLEAVRVEEALQHPTWTMGPKITVDSSTLMNKGLEVIEAHELFGPPAGAHSVGITLDDIDVVVHPQSIVHSMVTYADGSTIAQLSNPTMHNPIGYALAFPGRWATGFGTLDWTESRTLEFESPDRKNFPCLDLAFEAGRLGGTAPAWLSAANEVTVEAFLKQKIRWVDIPDVLNDVLHAHDGGTGTTLDSVLDGDAEARRRAAAAIEHLPNPA